MVRFLVLLASALVLTLTNASAVLAQDARDHFLRGQAAYETGEYETAASEWQRAYELDPRPALQYNLAQAYERLGRLEDAVRAYRAFLEEAPDDDLTSQARARVTSLEQRVRETSIQLRGGVDGASIFIDGEERGSVPHSDPLRVEPGSHRVLVRAEGYEDFVSVIAVSAGQRAEVAVELQPARGASGEDHGSDGGQGISTVGVIVAASGGALLIGGAITGGLALAAAGDAPDSTGSRADEARTLALVTDILLPVGAAAAIAGVILMFVLPEGGDEQARVLPVAGPDYAGVAISGAF